MTEFIERAVILQNEISLYKRKSNRISTDRNEEIKNENEWGASYLYAAFLEKSTESEFFSVDRKKLDLIYEQFNHETGKVCDLDSLFTRNWLRLVNDKVHIAGTIRFFVRDIEKVVGLDNEFSFLSELQSQYNNETIKEEIFSKAIGEYQARYNVSIDLERVIKAHWITITDKNVKISNLIYYEPYLKHADDFLFINKLRSLLFDGSGLLISQEVTSVILQRHQNTFPSTPSLNTFLEKKVFTQHNDSYFLNFQTGDIVFKGIVHDKAGALLWEKLINNSSFKNDVERIRFWYDRMVYRHSWCSISNHFQSGSQARFLDAAIETLLNDNDLTSGEDEFKKLQLDQGYRSTSLAYILSYQNKTSQFPTTTDLFFLYDSLDSLDKDWQGELMFNQESREDLVYFIHQIVRNDSASKYTRIIKLLEAGSDKPFLLWKTGFAIHHNDPGIIPFLLMNETTASLAFRLLSKTKDHNGIFRDRSDLSKKIIFQSFHLLCDLLSRSVEINSTVKARIFFQTFLNAENEKFEIIGPGIDRQQDHKKETTEIVTTFRSLFENASLTGTYYIDNYARKKLLFPFLLTEIFGQISNYEPVNYLKNHVITLPFIKLDMLAWTLQLIIKTNEVELTNYNVCKAFLTSYLDALNCTVAETWDHGSKKMVDQLPAWANQHPNLELIDWKNVLLTLEKERLLEEFLDPSGLQFKEAKDRFDAYNSLVANKIRTHLSILLIVYNDLYSDKAALKAKGFPVTTVLDKLELKITWLITQYAMDVPEKARLDIFNEVHERTFSGPNQQELLPIVATTINRFRNENKNKIVKDLLQTDKLVRAFKLLDYLVSEKDKEFLLVLITENNIEEFLSVSYQNDAAFVLQRLVEEKKFQEKARQALDIWENRKIRHFQYEKDEHLIMCFRMKLLLAFHDLDEEKINNTPSPKLENPGNLSFSPDAERDFYRALIWFHKNEPQKAYKIFDTQFQASKEDRPVLALNKFAANLNWAEQTKETDEKKKLFLHAIEEWNDFEKKLTDKSKLDHIKDKIWYNKLHAYYGLERDVDFDFEFNKLDRHLQLRYDFLELRIKYLMQRKMKYHAELLLSEAEEYHRLSNDQVPENIVKLRELTETEETLKELQYQYQRIFLRAPAELIKILPGNLNKFSSLEEFLLGELVGAATDMLTFINSISDITKEDKFSDLMILALVSRCRNFGWHVGPARGGFPGSLNTNPGLIDYSIWAANKDRIATCEALQIKGIDRNEVQSHNFKIFNYDSVRKLYFIVVYFNGDGDKFDKVWESYKTDIATRLIYPTGFELKSGSLEDISEGFGTNSIMIVKTVHGNATNIYHLFINIKYVKTQNK